MTLTLAFPWALLLLPAPLIVYWFTPPHRQQRVGLVVPFLPRLSSSAGVEPQHGAVVIRSTWGRAVWVGLAWVCLVAATARPQVIEPPVTKTISVRDMLLAVDLSGSMETQDFTNAKGAKVDRLTAVKEVL